MFPQDEGSLHVFGLVLRNRNSEFRGASTFAIPLQIAHNAPNSESQQRQEREKKKRVAQK